MYTHPIRSDELCHHGIKGMHWGVRRYQNPDGSYTSEGRKRYEIASQASEYSKRQAKRARLNAKDYRNATREYKKKYIDNPNGQKKWLKDMYGSDYKNHSKNVKKSINEDYKRVKESNESVAKLYDNDVKKWEAKAKYYSETPVGQLTRKDIKEGTKLAKKYARLRL